MPKGMKHDYGDPAAQKKRNSRMDLGQTAPKGGQAKNDFVPGKGKNVGNNRGPVMGYSDNPGMHKMKY